MTEDISNADANIASNASQSKYLPTSFNAFALNNLFTTIDNKLPATMQSTVGPVVDLSVVGGQVVCVGTGTYQTTLTTGGKTQGAPYFSMLSDNGGGIDIMTGMPVAGGGDVISTIWNAVSSTTGSGSSNIQLELGWAGTKTNVLNNDFQRGVNNTDYSS